MVVGSGDTFTSILDAKHDKKVMYSQLLPLSFTRYAGGGALTSTVRRHYFLGCLLNYSTLLYYYHSIYTFFLAIHRHTSCPGGLNQGDTRKTKALAGPRKGALPGKLLGRLLEKVSGNGPILTAR